MPHPVLFPPSWRMHVVPKLSSDSGEPGVRLPAKTKIPEREMMWLGRLGSPQNRLLPPLLEPLQTGLGALGENSS